MTIENRDLKLEAAGRPFNAFLAQPVQRGGPGVLVLHAWWGLNSFFKEICNQLAGEGFTALAPDLFQGHVAGTVEEAEGLLHLAQDNVELLQEILRTSLHELRSMSISGLGVMGFSMGASRAMAAAENDPDIKALVLFYGIGGGDFEKYKAAVQGHFAENDTYESLEDVGDAEAGMKAAGLDVEFFVYPETRHWFMEHDRPEYDQVNAEAAWKRTIDFLHSHLDS